jgi:hypothetical protein
MVFAQKCVFLSEGQTVVTAAALCKQGCGSDPFALCYVGLFLSKGFIELAFGSVEMVCPRMLVPF